MRARWMLGGAVIGLIAALLLMPLVTASLDRLSQLRAARLAEAAALATPVRERDDFRLASGSAVRAQAALASRLRRMASANGVLVERMAGAAPLTPGIARFQVALSGSEKAVLSVATSVERDLAGTRWRTWRIAGQSRGAIRFEGEAAVAWR